jgi:5'-nucleotidase
MKTAFSNLESFQIDLHHRVFVNRTLNLNSIKLIGFDMDYTLVIYHEKELEALAFEGAVDVLVRERGYPEAIRSLKFSSEKIIRGLVADKKLGNLVKINRFGYIKAALHGDRFYTLEEQKRLYADEIVSLHSSRYEMAHTMFSLANCSLFCQLVDRAELGKSFEDLYNDIRESLDQIHRDGSLKAKILKNPEKYIQLNPEYAATLQMLRDSGKKLALITNSEWSFTQEVMSFSFDRYLPAGQTWRDLFRVVVVDAAKPVFFTEEHKFFEVIPESGLLRNTGGKIREGAVYQGGNSAAIEKLFGLSSSEILYVGDHIYSDVYQSKKNCRWRTMLVITELDEELISSERGADLLEQIREWMSKKERRELELDQVQKRRFLGTSWVAELAQLSDEEVLDRSARLKEEIMSLDQELGRKVNAYNALFNPYWGELLWAGNDKSHFSTIIERYACVYSSRVSNLLYYSASHYFRPPIKGPVSVSH